MPHILFLMSDTGGGHRAASRAIEAALQDRYPNQFTVELVDVWKDYYPFPLNTLPRNYSRWVNANSFTYSAQYWLFDRALRNRKLSEALNYSTQSRFRRLYQEHPADIIVCVHSVFVRPAAYTLRRMKLNKPFITVITDYALPTVLWYYPDVDRCLVPTEPAFQRGLTLGLKPPQLVLTGAPVHPKFTRLALSHQEARAQLGWREDLPVVMLVGGGDGMGPLVTTAQALDSQSQPFQLAIIAGRNAQMKASLESMAWQHPTYIYGFVNNIEVFMRGADLLVTKAGPATITEAALLETPLVISGAIRHQESPNTEYVVANQAGVYAPGPEIVAQKVSKILADPEALARLKAGIKRLAQPEAIWRIADEIRSYA